MTTTGQNRGRSTSFGRFAVTAALIAALSPVPSIRLGADERPAAVERETVRKVPAPAGRLTTDGLLKRDPIFWPGGKELVYSVEEEGSGRMRLMRLDLGTGTSRLFHEGADISDRELSVSADASVHAYITVRGLSSRITVEDGKRSRRVTVPSAGIANWCNWPSVAPGGDRVVFTEGASAIFSYDLVENAGKKSLRRLTREGVGYSDLWPSFSPDGRKIVFTTRRDNDFEIYVMNADGSKQTRLTRSKGIDARAVFSPDGKRIAFTSNRDGNYEVYVMRADGSDPRRVTRHPERDDHACWWPDGKSLVVVSERDGRFDLYRVPAPGS